ncbi:cupin domain-containing protein [Psychroflexus salis]|uniref:DUF985 domain-containing protein n=1 Tax=Psychroflexus salis TaxID=1526574 RepID=A0A917EBM9_9FLAO|nr:cupin domain-containing protein [Psychroflexus salis]GGE17583.1 hypothetical protein GCM10010831_18540 [Psychroflexus salis]
MHNKADYIIQKLGLQKHPEGGYFKETYRSNKNVFVEDLDGKRNFSTCIYFLITNEAYSAFHKVSQDEIWHFYEGSCIHLHLISPDGTFRMQKIGNAWNAGELPQFVVPAQTWFAAEVIQTKAYALVGCTVSPGFDFKDFQLADKKQLLEEYPEHEQIIDRLTR